VRIASFNIHGGQLGGRPNLPPLVAACIDLDADILGLQEVDRRRRRSAFADQAKVVARGMACDHVYGPTRLRIVRGQYGNALIARGTIKDVEIPALPDSGTNQQRRAAVLARVVTGDVHVSVAVTHLSHHPKRLDHLPDEAPDQLAAVLEWLRERPAPRILMGDFNMQPPRVEPILAEAGFEIAPTGPAYPVDDPKIQLDYLAVDGLDIESAGIAPINNVSDHRPIVAKVRLPR